MVNLLAKKFIKNYNEVDNENVRSAYGILCSLLGILFNVFLFGIKYFAGILSGSIAIMADAFNNLSDAGSSLITLIGFKFAGMEPDNEHPFGHGRIEYIAGFIVSVLIILMGVELFKSSVIKIFNPEAIDTSLISIVILIISILVKLYMSLYNSNIGKKINSSAMKATATDSKSDCIATTVVLISMLILKLTGLNIDGYSGVLVACFILYAGYDAAKETLSPLLGQLPDNSLVQNIEQIVMNYDEIVGIHDLVVHDYGPGRLMISLHAEVPGSGDIFVLHDAIDRAEMELSKKLHCEAVIHLDPIDTDDEETMRMKDLVSKKIKEELDEIISIHDFRMVKGPSHTNVIFDAVIPPKYKMSEKEVEDKIKELVSRNFKNHFAVVKVESTYI
ncbi:cation diffusion facilitator family transporter [Anaerofustis stercorihominis]|uniref:ATP synthase F0, A subunit n=2 Tax=Anaerofustis stercorihominis TaxID=214853 RepID=B1C920_9FIRM|nr:cation diffusion facilitator family transporter [Anaerofustis stercorihominis]EDS72080.1 putative ATP synthase F0, A subunit [Anaerofustis stercorihominis DSM 17244]MCQ4795871.1 cation diffusion facilitator family transporter [Anaerofustis stercorihominis]RGD75858.1 cation transporter [Anaerofustis stercorihominis]